MSRRAAPEAHGAAVRGTEAIRVRRAFLRRGVAAALALALPAADANAPREIVARFPGDTDSNWQRIRQRGSLVVGLYQEMPPFHDQGRGIDADLGRALAAEMELGYSALPFAAGENMGDDLRNMVWKGHYLGWGPADVLLHVPVDAPLMRDNPQVRIVAPYYRERVAIAFDRQRLRSLESLADLRGHAVSVAGLSLAGWLMLGAEDGLLRDQLQTRWADGVAAARALKSGQVVAAAGLMSELECVLSGDERYAVQPLPSPRAPREGWAVGCAVRKDAAQLATRVELAMHALRTKGKLQAIFRDHRVTP